MMRSYDYKHEGYTAFVRDAWDMTRKAVVPQVIVESPDGNEEVFIFPTLEAAFIHVLLLSREQSKRLHDIAEIVNDADAIFGVEV